MPANTLAHEHRDTPVFGAMFTIDQLKRANAEAGQHYFEPSTMRFFRSRVMPTVTAGRLFVTSEQSDYNAPRFWTVREFMPDGGIETVGEFQEYTSGAAAQRAARRAASELHAYYFDGRHGKGGRRVTYVVT